MHNFCTPLNYRRIGSSNNLIANVAPRQRMLFDRRAVAGALTRCLIPRIVAPFGELSLHATRGLFNNHDLRARGIQDRSQIRSDLRYQAAHGDSLC